MARPQRTNLGRKFPDRKRPESDPEGRFLRATRRGEPPTYRPELGPCLLYLGATNTSGYGQFRFNERNGYAHRYAWERANGPIPDGLTIDHLCRVRICVEITHLDLCDGVTNYLRGVEARNACPNGHPYTEGSYLVTNTGKRRCKTCAFVSRRKSAEIRRTMTDRRRTLTVIQEKEIRARYAAGGVTHRVLAEEYGVSNQQISRVITGRRRDRNPRPGVNATVRGLVLGRSGGRCERCGVAFMVGDYSLQHRRSRNLGGSLAPDTNTCVNLAVLCGSATTKCHGWIEAHPLEAEEDGWRVRQGHDPSLVPILHHDLGLVFLLPDYTYSEELPHAVGV